MEESADDEGEDPPSAYESMQSSRESGWRRAERVASGSLAGEAATRSELLMREKSITDEALRTRSVLLRGQLASLRLTPPNSLSTLLSLRPSTGSSSTDIVDSPSLSSSPASNVTLRNRPVLDRRSTIVPMSSLPSKTRKIATPISRDDSSWDQVNLSSASSFEDLGLDLESEQDALIAGSSQQGRLLYSKPGAPAKRKKFNKKGQTKRRDAGGSSLSRGGFLSEPDVASARPDADFLNLLQAARTFSSMRPSHEAAGPPSSRNSSSRDASPAMPASMTSSTNFVLSSSDSPPSHDLASSREMIRSGSATRSPSPLPLEMEARLRLSREETITGTPQGEPYKPQSWWDWLWITVGPVGLGITAVSLIGLGLAWAGRTSLVRKAAVHTG